MDRKEQKRELAGICGIYCGTCPKYLAPRQGDTAEVQKMARDAGVTAGEVRCDGCLSGHVYRDCVDCRHGFRRCAREKGVTWCFQCAEFPCARLESFKDIHVVNGIWHHKKIVDHLQFMKEYGVEKWVDKEDAEGACPRCGKVLYWYARECPGCGHAR